MSVVACPKCQEKVTLPAKAPPAAKVRCPLCGENYELSEALALAPPMLEIIELPEGYEEPQADDFALGSSSFGAAIHRPAPMADDDVEVADFRLQDDGSVATEEEDTPQHDEWGSVKSTAPIHEPTVRKEPLPIRRKKKGTNPLIHVVGIVLGGALAFPAAFLILLWLPGSLRRDPVNIGPWLGKNAPFLVPADLRAGAKSNAETAAQAPVDVKTPTDTMVAKATSKKPAANEEQGTGLQLGNQFEEALKNKETSITPSNQEDEEESPLVGGFGGQEKPSLKNPPTNDPFATPEPRIDPFTTPEPTLELPKSAPVEPKSDPEPALTPEPSPAPESTPEPATSKPAEPKPTEPVPAPAQPEPMPDSPVADALAPAREALVKADEAFNVATVPAEKKNTAIAMYNAAADLAAQLPQDAPSAETFNMLTSDAMKLQFVGVYTASWLDNAERGSNGAVLSGNVKSSKQAGEKFEVTVELPTRDKREVVIIAPVACKEGMRIFAAGRVVENAKDMIGGYEGEVAKAIDARIVQPIE